MCPPQLLPPGNKTVQIHVLNISGVKIRTSRCSELIRCQDLKICAVEPKGVSAVQLGGIIDESRRKTSKEARAGSQSFRKKYKTPMSYESSSHDEGRMTECQALDLVPASRQYLRDSMLAERYKRQLCYDTITDLSTLATFMQVCSTRKL